MKCYHEVACPNCHCSHTMKSGKIFRIYRNIADKTDIKAIFREKKKGCWQLYFQLMEIYTILEILLLYMKNSEKWER